MLACVGCGSSEKRPTQATAPPAPVPAATRKPSDSVVFVRARFGRRTTSGTGFIYDAREGLILTSDHAIEASPAVTVATHDGRVYHGRALARAQCHDFAVVRLHPLPSDLQALSFGDSDAVRTGQTLTSITYTASADAAAVPPIQTAYGRVTGVGVSAILHPLLPAFDALIAHATPLTAAGSGSPVLDRAGQVIGLNTLVGYRHGRGTHAGQQYAIAANEIYALLRHLNRGPEETLAGWRREHRCHRAMDAIAGVPFQHSGGAEHGAG
jgi:S1-C subfamily serine protease